MPPVPPREPWGAPWTKGTSSNARFPRSVQDPTKSEAPSEQPAAQPAAETAAGAGQEQAAVAVAT
eukprot:9474400-Pyramimonas_sp.AAC.2